MVSEKWYDVTVEVKGDEVVFQIDGAVLYAKDALITEERANTFNIDSGGDGYVFDNISVWQAGNFTADWELKRKQVAE